MAFIAFDKNQIVADCFFFPDSYLCFLRFAFSVFDFTKSAPPLPVFFFSFFFRLPCLVKREKKLVFLCYEIVNIGRDNYLENEPDMAFFFLVFLPPPPPSPYPQICAI